MVGTIFVSTGIASDFNTANSQIAQEHNIANANLGNAPQPLPFGQDKINQPLNAGNSAQNEQQQNNQNLNLEPNNNKQKTQSRNLFQFNERFQILARNDKNNTPQGPQENNVDRNFPSQMNMQSGNEQQNGEPQRRGARAVIVESFFSIPGNMLNNMQFPGNLPGNMLFPGGAMLGNVIPFPMPFQGGIPGNMAPFPMPFQGGMPGNMAPFPIPFPGNIAGNMGSFSMPFFPDDDTN